MLYSSILFCSLNPEKHITTSDPPLLLPSSICTASNIHHTAPICPSDKSRRAHDSPGGLCDTGSRGGSRADRQNQKEEMCEAMECVLTADCTTQDSVSYSGRTWWSDSWNKHTGRHTLQIPWSLKKKYPEADTGIEESPHDSNFHKLQ